jgi:SNF2 family DNA or RNA helicase
MAFHLARANHELSKTNHSLLPHQIDALKWMVRRESTKGPKGGILADDMGLGKTLETISLILSSKITNTLIIVPANLVDQWISEFTKFAPHISVSNNIGDHQEGTIIITSYIKAIRSTYIKKFYWDRIVLDEAHFIRNPKGTVHKSIVALKGNCRWCLSGTPIQNYMKDIHSLLSFVGFRNIQPEVMSPLLKKYMLRRTKEGLKFDLPPIEMETTTVEYESPEEKQFYEKVRENTFMAQDVNHLEILLRLRQASLLPQMVHDGYRRKIKDGKTFKWKYTNSKLDAIVATLKEKTEERPIVFCYFTQEIQYLANKLAENEIEFEIINGSVSMSDRQEIIARAPTFRVMIVQMMAGSTGLNLQAFNSVYFSGPHWNPTHEQQAIARVYRYGQTQAVMVRRFIMKGTIEELIVRIQERKTEMISEFVAHRV